MTALRTLDQERAAAALHAVEEVRGRDVAREYRSHAEGLPAMLVSSGLAPALAFLSAKGAGGKGGEPKAPGYLARHLATWVLPQVFGREPARDPILECFQSITGCDSTRYRIAEREALELAVWIKRFAQAYLPRPEGGGE